MASVSDFATWEPVLRLMLTDDAYRSADRSARVAGRISRYGWSLGHQGSLSSTRSAVEDIQRSLARGGVQEIAFSAEVRADGTTTLGLVWPSPVVEPAVGYPDLGVLLLADGSLPEPWLRRPEPVPGAMPAPSADPGLLERTLRERLPDAIGATEEEISAAGVRLGVPLSDELKVLYRVTRVDGGDDFEAADRAGDAVGCELFGLEHLGAVDAAGRHRGWNPGAKRAVRTGPGTAVQGLAGSPGWIRFGTNGGDEFAVDLTPGPAGHLGQIILIDHERSLGAELVADSLTDFVLGRMRADGRGPGGSRLPAEVGVGVGVGVGTGHLETVEAAAHPALEVLSVGPGNGEPYSLAPVAGLPRLRTLTASPGTLADPMEVAGLTGLEFLELGAREWRVLLDAGAVPRTLKAAAITVHNQRHLPVVPLANEILALWNRPRIAQTLLHGDLGPGV
ncbi:MULTISPECIES: SMI1/KNR4 family protein [unclassified Streptomyces]|uniref:SMI1/KNR4 family protein n=1 Tax=unclassified Streptomyces TaxID=2593676 RepID=UPI000823D3B1|nr:MULTISPECIES: SMI1/KNR4 family protein [unclassified Streptomyces]SCK39798.1 Cell wall assembly regulator SMI1 [Streptomyces sp. AmelKG-E11A]